jgi:hypothetical protein
VYVSNDGSSHQARYFDGVLVDSNPGEPMRIVILNDTFRLGAGQPRVIDVASRSAWTDRPWWHRALATLVVLLAVVAFPIVWMIAGLTVLAAAGLSALAVATLWMRQRMIAARERRAADENVASRHAPSP